MATPTIDKSVYRYAYVYQVNIEDLPAGLDYVEDAVYKNYADASHIAIRCVGPVGQTFGSQGAIKIDDNDGDVIEAAKLDHLVSANVVCVTQVITEVDLGAYTPGAASGVVSNNYDNIEQYSSIPGKLGNTTDDTQYDVVQVVKHFTRDGGHPVIDIIISYGSNSIIKRDKAHITVGLTFASGFVDTVGLYLRAPGQCVIDYPVSFLTQTAFEEMILNPSAKDLPGLSAANAKVLTAYNWAKTYYPLGFDKSKIAGSGDGEYDGDFLKFLDEHKTSCVINGANDASGADYMNPIVPGFDSDNPGTVHSHVGMRWIRPCRVGPSSLSEGSQPYWGEGETIQITNSNTQYLYLTGANNTSAYGGVHQMMWTGNQTTTKLLHNYDAVSGGQGLRDGFDMPIKFSNFFNLDQQSYNTGTNGDTFSAGGHESANIRGVYGGVNGWLCTSGQRFSQHGSTLLSGFEYDNQDWGLPMIFNIGNGSNGYLHLKEQVNGDLGDRMHLGSGFGNDLIDPAINDQAFQPFLGYDGTGGFLSQAVAANANDAASTRSSIHGAVVQPVSMDTMSAGPGRNYFAPGSWDNEKWYPVFKGIARSFVVYPAEDLPNGLQIGALSYKANGLLHHAYEKTMSSLAQQLYVQFGEDYGGLLGENLNSTQAMWSCSFIRWEEAYPLFKYAHLGTAGGTIDGLLNYTADLNFLDGVNQPPADTIRAHVDTAGWFASMYTTALPYQERIPHLDEDGVIRSQNLIGRGEIHSHAFFNNVGALMLSSVTNLYQASNALSNAKTVNVAAQDLVVYISSPVFRGANKNNSTPTSIGGSKNISYYNSWIGATPTAGVSSEIVGGSNSQSIGNGLTVNTTGATVFDTPYSSTSSAWPVTEKQPIINYPAGDAGDTDLVKALPISYPGQHFNTPSLTADPTESLRFVNNSSTSTSGSSGSFGAASCGIVIDTYIQSTSTDNGSATVIFDMFYLNTCGSTDLQTAEGYSFVDETHYATLSQRVTAVLQIFPVIRYTPGRFTHGEGGSYEVNVEDATDVDDIRITDIGNGMYQLRCQWTADANDVDPDENPAEFTNVFGDINETGWVTAHQDYLSSGEQLIPGTGSLTSPKASAITISTIDGTSDLAGIDDVYRADATNDSSNTDLSLYLPFHAWAKSTGVEPPPPPPPVEGCTDDTALNYNAAATVDDGSCEYCEDILPQAWSTTPNGLGILGVTNTFSAAGYMQSAQSVVNKLKSGHNPEASTAALFDNVVDYPQLAGAGGVKHGGAFFMETNVPGTLRTASNLPNPKFRFNATSMITTQVQDLITAAGLDQSDIFTCKLYANSDENITAVGSTQEDVFTTTQKDLGTPLVTVNGDTTGVSSIVQPIFDFSSNFPVYSGSVFIIEVEMDFKSLSSTCGDARKTFYAYQFFVVTFCGCGIAGNQFTETGWPWSTVSAFPAVVHNSSIPHSLACSAFPAVTEPDYNGDNSLTNVCFTPDTNLDSCEGYWSWCIHDSSTICADVPVDEYVETIIDDTTVLIQPPQTTFSTSVEGYWNPVNNVYSLEGIEYTMTVTLTQNGVVTQTFTQTHEDAILDQPQPGLPGVLNNYFTIIGAGTIGIEINFEAPYTDPNLTLTPNCVFTESFDVEGTGCDELLEGCTDSTAVNFNPEAVIDDGSCDFPTPCDEFYLNPAVQNLAATGTNATSVCQTITTTVGNEEVTYEIATAQSDGTITITGSIIDENAELDVTQFSIAWIYANGDFDPPINDYSGALDALASQYQNAITGDGATDGITVGGFAAWSPLLDLNADGTFSVTLGTASAGLGFIPGVYNYYVVPYIYGNDSIPENCPQEPITVFDAGSSYTVQLTDIECEEPCVQLPCGDQISGCTDPSASNYNADATIDDGSCEFETTFCEQYPEHPACNDCEAVAEALGVPVEKVCEGTIGDEAGACTDPNACNYDYNASLDNTNNALCDYCSCADPNDPDCFPDQECDPDEDPNCLPPEPPCPDPENPDCTVNPTVTCPTPEDCPPPPNPCIILGNCTPDSDPPPVNDDVFDATVTFETTCEIDVANSSGQAISFAHLQNSALTCMSEEGTKMLFKLKAGVKIDRTELQKLSMIAYIMLGGAERTDLPCIWNCNYDSATRQNKRNTNDCNTNWADGNFRIWNSTDSFSQGQTVAYHFYRNGRLTRGLFVAKRDIFPHEPHPRFPQSGWEVCKDRRLRTKDTNGIADGTENYMQIFFEYINRYCQSCSVVGQAGRTPMGYVEATNLQTDGLDVPERKTNDFNDLNTFGILDENGNEIDF